MSWLAIFVGAAFIAVSVTVNQWLEDREGNNIGYPPSKTDADLESSYNGQLRANWPYDDVA